MWELFFAFFLEIFEKVAVSAETVFAGDGVFEDGGFERSESERHVTAKENKEADAGKISENMPHGAEIDNGVKSELGKNNGKEKGENIYREDRLFGEFLVGVENGGDEDGKDEQGSELGTEVVGVFAIVVAIVEAPEKGGGDGDFDVLPGGFVDGSEEPDRAVLAGEVVEKMGESASSRDDDDAKPHNENIVHIFIIA